MAVVSISEAARLTGKSRKTIQRYVSDGRISMSQHVAGRSGIDISELVRVFGELSQSNSALSHATESQPDAPSVAPDVAAKLARLEAENAVLKAQNEAQAANLADLRQSLRLLGHDAPQKRRWWQFGKS
ncbi:helix-turn-helix domain-containing protein [Caballeronia sordidicola]|uniref:helix-turn-helix domain-containing protein n=1 Tax=Caballeronia sordidicola TaxID=196367 RepID=UPI00094D8A4D|nr:helix-turn-helix domain-containing protein [Caballeronia sordidicola]